MSVVHPPLFHMPPKNLYDFQHKSSNYASRCRGSISSRGEGSIMSIPSSSVSMVPLYLSL